jgi:hypothetical protein
MSLCRAFWAEFDPGICQDPRLHVSIPKDFGGLGRMDRALKGFPLVRWFVIVIIPQNEAISLRGFGQFEEMEALHVLKFLSACAFLSSS